MYILNCAHVTSPMTQPVKRELTLSEASSGSNSISAFTPSGVRVIAQPSPAAEFCAVIQYKKL